jgi:hypothetical protein
MEATTFQLTPESARALALRLFTKEQFRSDPKGCIVAALDWLDRAAGEPGESTSFANPVRDSRIERLDRIIRERGPEAVAREIGASINSLRAWLHGSPPNAASLTKIERFLENSQSPSTAGVEHSTESGELFAADKEPEPEVPPR